MCLRRYQVGILARAPDKGRRLSRPGPLRQARCQLLMLWPLTTHGVRGPLTSPLQSHPVPRRAMPAVTLVPHLH